jgi:CRISPR-associated endonuclease/helicase Cas3
MEHQMLPPNSRHGLNATSFWMRDHARLTAFLQQAQPFRDQPRPDADVVWLPDEDDVPHLHRVEEGERKFQKLYARIDDSQCQRVPDAAVRGDGISCWAADADFARSMADQADAMGLSLEVFAQRYAGATLPVCQEGWRWHPVLGFAVNRGG